MEDIINKHIDEVERLEQIVVDNAEKILPQIDLDALLKDPRGYLGLVITAFVEDHTDEVVLAEKEGVRFGKTIIKTNTIDS